MDGEALEVTEHIRQIRIDFNRMQKITIHEGKKKGGPIVQAIIAKFIAKWQRRQPKWIKVSEL